MNAAVAVTVYRGARNATPSACDALPWGAFCSEVEALCTEETTATDKRDLIALGPYRLRDGATRATANVEAMSAVAMLDVDGVDLERLRGRLHELGVAAVVHGSPSDDPAGARKVRIFVALDGEHAPADAGAVRDSVAALLGVQHDAATRNADRIGFCGRLAGTAPRYVERFDGVPLALAELPRVATAPRAAPTAPAAVAREGDPARDAATWAILGAVGPWHAHDGRKHALCGALGGVLRHAGATREDCAELIRAWLPEDEPGVDVAAGVAWACAAWDRLPQEVSGRAALDALIGPVAGAVVEQAALLPWRIRRGVTPAAAPAPDADGDAPAPSPWPTINPIDWRHPPELAYVVPALELAPGKVSAIQGYAYCAKTPLALLLAICVAAGVDFLGCPVSQGAAVYLDHEPSVLTQERAVRICAGLGVDAAALALHYCTPPEPLSIPYLEELERFVRVNAVRLVVVDTYSSAIPADGSFNDSNFRDYATKLGTLSHATQALVVVLVHENKEAGGARGLRGISGHGSLAGALQAAIVLSRPDDDAPNVIRLSCGRATRKGFDAFDVEWSDADDGAALVATRRGAGASSTSRRSNAANAARAGDAAARTRAAGEAIMRAMQPGVWTPRRELCAVGGEGYRAAERALARLVAAGLVELRAGQYATTTAGAAATSIGIATALGATAGFQR